MTTLNVCLDQTGNNIHENRNSGRNIAIKSEQIYYILNIAQHAIANENAQGPGIARDKLLRFFSIDR